MKFNIIICSFLILFGYTPVSAQIVTQNDRYTGELVEFTATKYWYDNTLMNESKVDNILYIRKGNLYYKRNLGSCIKVEWFGLEMKSDISNWLEKISKVAFSLGKSLCFPSKAVYQINRSTKLYSTIIGNGTTINMPSKHNRFLMVQNDNITIDNFKLLVQNNIKQKNAPIAIEISGHNNFIVSNCTILNSRINSSNFSKALSRNININKNVFKANFSNYESYNVQNDIIYIYNIDGLYIKDNLFEIHNSNRVMKISSFQSDGSIISKNIHIEANKIYSTTTSKKQVIDLYQFTKDIIIKDNYFETNGHNSIIENKTTSKQDYNTNLNIINNIFNTDGTSIRLFGTYGSLENKESGFQNVNISGNSFKCIDKSNLNINIAHYHYVNITNNKFQRLTRSSHLRIAGIDNLQIVNNNFENGDILITDEYKVDSKVYSSKFNSLTVSNNIFRNLEHSKNVLTISNAKSINIVSFDGNKIHSGDISIKPNVVINSSNIMQIKSIDLDLNKDLINKGSKIESVLNK